MSRNKTITSEQMDMFENLLCDFKYSNVLLFNHFDLHCSNDYDTDDDWLNCLDYLLECQKITYERFYDFFNKLYS